MNPKTETNKNVTETLSPSAQRYLTMMPALQEEKTQKVTTLVLTLFALCILGVFAIRPSLTTISDLKKQLADDLAVEQALEQKISNLNALQTQFTQIETDIPIVLSAVPQSPLAPILVGQLQTLAQDDNLAITSSQVFQVQLSQGNEAPAGSAYEFSIEAKGSNEDIANYLKDLASFERIVVFNSISITSRKDDPLLSVIIRGRSFFKQ